MSVMLTPGQAGDNPQLLPLLDQIAVGRDGPGRPRKRPDRVLADKAYSRPSTRTALRSRGIAFTSPERGDQIERRRAKGPCGGRPPAFDPQRYAHRNVVERCFNRLRNMAEVEEWHDVIQAAQVENFKQLVRTIKATLRNAQVFRVGDLRVDIYVVGQIEGGHTGLRTSAVET
jgi:transposase